MRGVELESGVFVRIGVKHAWDVRSFKVPHQGFVSQTCRVTQVMFTGDDGVSITAEAVCNPNDNFCKLSGRKVAASKLLKELNGVSKTDKKKIFENICPEFTAK